MCTASAAASTTSPAPNSPTTPPPPSPRVAADARELDALLQRYHALPHADPAEACRLFYEMSQGAFRRLGYRSFSRYLRDRKIPLSWAHLRKSIHEKLVLELGLPALAWSGLPLSKLRLALPTITADNAGELLEATRTSSLAALRRRLGRDTNSTKRPLTGTYRLVPISRQQCTRPETYQTVGGTVYAAGDDWYVDFPEAAEAAT